MCRLTEKGSLTLFDQPVGRLTLRRRISLLVVALSAAALAVLSHGCSSPDTDAGSSDENLSFDLNDQKLKDRLGEDDGYSFAILYGADIHGSLETCG